MRQVRKPESLMVMLGHGGVPIASRVLAAAEEVEVAVMGCEGGVL